MWTSGVFHGSCSGLSMEGCRGRGFGVGNESVGSVGGGSGFEAAAGVAGCWGGFAASSEVSGNAGCLAFLLVKADDDNWGCGRSGKDWVVLSANDVSPLSYGGQKLIRM